MRRFIFFAFSFQQGTAAPLHPPLENSGSIGGLRTSCEKILFRFSFQQGAVAPLHPPLENSGSIGGFRTPEILSYRLNHFKPSENVQYVSLKEPSKFGMIWGP